MKHTEIRDMLDQCVCGMFNPRIRTRRVCEPVAKLRCGACGLSFDWWTPVRHIVTNWNQNLVLNHYRDLRRTTFNAHTTWETTSGVAVAGAVFAPKVPITFRLAMDGIPFVSLADGRNIKIPLLRTGRRTLVEQAPDLFEESDVPALSPSFVPVVERSAVVETREECIAAICDLSGETRETIRFYDLRDVEGLHRWGNLYAKVTPVSAYTFHVHAWRLKAFGGLST